MKFKLTLYSYNLLIVLPKGLKKVAKMSTSHNYTFAIIYLRFFA